MTKSSQELQPYKNFWNRQLEALKQLSAKDKKDQATKSAEIKNLPKKT